MLKRRFFKSSSKARVAKAIGKMIRRGQISTEYLITAAFIMFLIISTLAVSLFYSNQTRDRIKFNQLQNFANKLISSSESVYYSGEPSKATIIAYLPGGVEGIEIIGNELVFNISSTSGMSRIAFPSKVPIQGIISNNEGAKSISIVALEDGVVWSEG